MKHLTQARVQERVYIIDVNFKLYVQEKTSSGCYSVCAIGIAPVLRAYHHGRLIAHICGRSYF